MAQVREQGEENQYCILTDDGRDWLAMVHLNGELTLSAQREIMAEIVLAFRAKQHLLTSQGRI